MPPHAGQVVRTHCPYPISEGEGRPADVDHLQPVQLQGRHGGSHGLRHAGTVRTLEFEPEPQVAAHDKQVQLGATMDRPEVALLRARAQLVDDLGQGKPLPAGTYLGMGAQLCGPSQPEQRVQDTAVRDVESRGLDDPRPDVAAPWSQLPHQKQTRHVVHVPPYSGVRDTERASKLAGIPGLAVVVREHREEVVQESGGKGDAEAGKVNLD